MIIFLTISAFFTSIISAVVGMAGGIVLLSIMTFFLPLNIIIPIHGLVQLVSNTTRTWLLRTHIIRSVFLYFMIGLPFGGLTAVYLIKQVDSKIIPLCFIAFLIIYTLFKPKKLPSLIIPHWAFSFIGFFVGVLGPLIGATGPFMAPFFLRKDWKKESIVATKASVQVMGHLIKIPVFLSIEFPYMDYALPILLMAAVSLLGTKIGVQILGKIEDKIFRWVYKTALFMALIKLLTKIYSLI
jgi:uncharacterized protein